MAHDHGGRRRLNGTPEQFTSGSKDIKVRVWAGKGETRPYVVEGALTTDEARERELRRVQALDEAARRRKAEHERKLEADLAYARSLDRRRRRVA